MEAYQRNVALQSESQGEAAPKFDAGDPAALKVAADELEEAASRPCRRDLTEIETRANREGANKTLLRLIQDLPDAYRGELEKRGGPFSPMEPILLARAKEVLGGVRSEA